MIELIQAEWLYFLIGQYPNGPLGGLALTILLASLGLLLSIPLGLLFGLARVSSFSLIRKPITFFVSIVRGLPLLMVIFWGYFFLPSVTGVKTEQFTTMLIALVIFDAAYLAEIVKSGILAVPKGQVEAGRSLGLSYFQNLRFIILPQSLKFMLPSLVNQFVATIKETSLGYVIGLSEISFIATQINNRVFTKPIEVYFILGLTYFVLCFGLSRFAFYLEQNLNQKKSMKGHSA